jgi:hypothetical protein
VRFKITGTPPAGFEKRLKELLEEYTPERAAEITRIKKATGKPIERKKNPLPPAKRK